MSGNIVATLRDTAQLSCIGDASASVWMPEWLKKELIAAADAIDERDAELAAAQATVAELRRTVDMAASALDLIRTDADGKRYDYAQGRTGSMIHVSMIVDHCRAMLAPAPQLTQEAAQPVRVYLVPTGETHEGRETYERHDSPPPLCDYETLYAAPQPQPAADQAARDAVDAARYRWLADNVTDHLTHPFYVERGQPCIVWSGDYGPTWRENLDATIDSAIAADAAKGAGR